MTNEFAGSSGRVPRRRGRKSVVRLPGVWARSCTLEVGSRTRDGLGGPSGSDGDRCRW